MTIKQQYNYKYLQQFCKENSITLSKDYLQEKINRDIKIEGKCKTFRKLTITDGFRKECIGLNRQHNVDLTNLINY